MSVLPRIALFFMFSHGIHGIHRTFLLYILPRNSRNTQNLLVVYSPTDCTDFHRCCFQGGELVSSAPTRSVVALLALLVYFLLCWCTSCSVGALETSAPPERTYLCQSVNSVGEYLGRVISAGELPVNLLLAMLAQIGVALREVVVAEPPATVGRQR